MEIIISGRNLDVTPELRNHVESKLEKLSGEYSKLTTIRVVMTLEKHWHVVEGHLTGKHLTLEARARTPDMYTSIDTVAEKLEIQLRRHVERLREHRAKRGEINAGDEDSLELEGEGFVQVDEDEFADESEEESGMRA